MVPYKKQYWLDVEKAAGLLLEKLWDFVLGFGSGIKTKVADGLDLSYVGA